MIDNLRRPRTIAPALQRIITDRWRCPVCRGKSGSDAVVLHHDHIEFYVSWLMEDTSRLPEPPIELKPVHDFNLLSGFITTVRGFPPTLICQSCNELDGANLKQRGAHVYFSLSATDLSAIYCGENEGGRARSFDLAFALWRRRAAAYGARLAEIAWLLRDHLAQARWQREPAGRCSEAASIMLRSASANWRLDEWDDGQEQPDMNEALQHASLDNGERYCQIRAGAG